jgi:transcriptional regulator with XRE-family HTH domain
VVIFRRLLGEVLRAQRMRQGRTLREVSAEARVSLGYISEIERGQKEASSELLASICSALDVPLSEILSEVSDAVALEEAALAMQVDKIRVEAVRLRPARAETGTRSGDVVASAA